MSLRSASVFAGLALLVCSGAALAQVATEAEKVDEDAEEAAAEQAPEPAPEPPGPFALPDDLPEESRDAAWPEPGRFVVIELHTEVSLGMASFVERVVASLSERDVLVVDINTFGGRVDAAVRIRDALLGVRRERGAWTVAYVHPRAISAGALIALACDVIAVAPGATMGAATPVQVSGGEMKPTDEKVVSYMRKEMSSTATARGRDGLIAEAMVDRDVEIPGLIAEGKLLTLDGEQALAWGIASFQADDREALAEKLGYGPGGRAYATEEVSWSWAEELAGWLSGSMLSGILMTVGMLGLMIGLYTGGNPVPLAVGGLSLALFFFGHHVVELAGAEELVVFLLGAALIIFEVLVPGYIFPGVLGMIMVIASLVMGLIDLDTVPLDVQWAEGVLMRALGTVAGSIVVCGVLTWAVFRLLPASELGRKLMLPAQVVGSASQVKATEERGLVGRLGVAATSLRPSGKVTVDGRRYDAVSRRGYVDAGDPVKVIERDGFSLVVHPVKREEA